MSIKLEGANELQNALNKMAKNAKQLEEKGLEVPSDLSEEEIQEILIKEILK